MNFEHVVKEELQIHRDVESSLRHGARFFNPFPGKPVALPLSGLFLFDPSVSLKLAGHPLRGLITELGDESLYKRFERTMKGAQAANIGLIRDLLGRLPADAANLAEMRAAADGDVQAQQRMQAMGIWEAYFKGGIGEEEQLTLHRTHILEIERASAEPHNLVRQGRLAEAMEHLARDPLTTRFFWPEAKTIFNHAANERQLVPLQASLAIEVHLSCLVAWDVELQLDGCSTTGSLLRDVLPSTESPGCNPTSLFFRWLKREVGASSMKALLEHPKARGLSLDIVTLKRWSRGSHHPSITWLRPLMRAFFGDAEYAPAWSRYWGAKHLNMLGFLAQQLSERTAAAKGAEQRSALLPWPAFPFGYTSFEEWGQARYGYWLAYHQQKSTRGREGQAGPSN